MARENKLKKASLGTGFMIGIAVIYLLFGLAMLFVPQFQERYIIYIAGLIFLICGVIMIVKYFMAASYNDLGNYGFSGGVLCILLGICLLVRTQQIAGYLPLFLGVCILLTAVIKLQNAVDLKSLRNGAWLLFLIIALAFLAAAILVILNPDGKVLQHREVLYYILIADGTVSIISPIYLMFAIRAGKRAKHSNRRENGKETERFMWLVTTLEAADYRVLWEMMHRRWDIEENGFHQLKTYYYAKHCYCRDAVETIFNLIIIGFNVRELYLYRRSRNFAGSGISRKSINRIFCDELLTEKVKQILYEKGG